MMYKKIKILFLIPSLRKTSPILGLLALIKYIDHDYYGITVSCLDNLSEETDSIAKELSNLNVRIKFFNLPGWFGLLKMYTVQKFIESEDFDIVHSYGIRPDIINAMINKRCISLSSVREIISDGYHLQYGPIISKVFSLIHIQALKQMDFIIAISNAIKDYLIRKNIDSAKIGHIPNFVDLSWMDSIKYQNNNNRCTSKDATINIGYIGYFIPRKRVDWIVTAVADILKKYPDSKIILHLIGDGPLRTNLKNLVGRLGIDHHVMFHGYVNDVASIMNNLELVVLASKSEGIPRALLESMSIGKTCIGPNIGGVNELIIDGITGYLFNSYSYSGLVEKIEYVLTGKRFLNPIKITKYIKDNFDAEDGAKKTLELYKRLIAKNK